VSSKLLAVIALFIGLVAPLRAGDTPADPEHEGREAPSREEIPQILDSYLLSNLQDRLGLSDAQQAKVVPLVMQYQKDTRVSRKQRMKAIGTMKKLLQSGTATEAQISEELGVLRGIEDDSCHKIRKDVEAIDGELTVIQRAKYRVLEHEVERRFFQLMRQAMMRPRPEERLERPRRDKADKSEEPAHKP
jgi:hypothetical protein